MRIPLTLTIKGGADVSDAVALRLDGLARQQGWRRQPHPTPGAFLFKTPPRRVWTATSAHDEGVDAFLLDVIFPLSQLVRFELSTARELSVYELAPEPVAVALLEFVFEEEHVPQGAFDPLGSGRFARIVALCHLTGAKLAGKTLARWFDDDRGWPEDVARALGHELDQGLAFLREHDPENQEVRS